MDHEGLSGEAASEGFFRESLTDKCIRRKCHATAGETGGIERSAVFPPPSTQNDFEVVFFFGLFFSARICQTDSERGKHFNATHRFPKHIKRRTQGEKNLPIPLPRVPEEKEKEYMWTYVTIQKRWRHLINKYNRQLFKG